MVGLYYLRQMKDPFAVDLPVKADFRAFSTEVFVDVFFSHVRLQQEVSLIAVMA